MAIAEITIVPLGTKCTSVSKYVAHIEAILGKQDKVKHVLTPMSTILEGDIKDIFDITLNLHESIFKMGEGRVSTSIKIDDRRDKVSTMESKLNSVKEKLSNI